MNAVIQSLKQEFSIQSIRYRLQLIAQTPTSIMGFLLLVIFGYFIAVPVLSLLFDAVQVQFGDERRIGHLTGEWTDYYLVRTLLSPISESLFGSH